MGAMVDTRTYRRVSGHVPIVVAGVVAALALITIAQADGRHGLLHLGALPLLFAALVWAVIERPFLRLDDVQLEMGNVFRRIRVPWIAITKLDRRRGLVAVTATGVYSAFAVPAPKRRPIGDTLSTASPYGDTYTPGNSPADLTATLAASSLLDDPASLKPPPGRVESTAATAATARWARHHAQAASGGVRDAMQTVTWNKGVVIICGVLVVLAAVGLATYF